MAFPTTVLDVTVEAAYGVDLSADPATWAFTDITSAVRKQDRIVIRRGRADEAGQAEPAQCQLVLLDPNGDHTPYLATGAHYPYVRTGLPIRVSIDNGSGNMERFSGHVSRLSPTSDTSGNLRLVAVTAAGPLRRVGRRSTPTRSALRRAIEAANPQRYWPMEDGPGATAATSAVAGIGPLVASGEVGYGGSGTRGTAGTVDLSEGGRLSSSAFPPSATSWRIEIAYACPPLNDVTGQAWPVVIYTTGTIRKVTAIVGGPFDDVVVSYEWSGGSASFLITDATLGTNADDGELHHIRIDATQVGADVLFSAAYDGLTPVTETALGQTIGSVSTVNSNETPAGVTSISAAAHLGMWTPIPAGTVDSGSAALGFAGELAGDRIERLCVEEGVPVVVTGGADTVAMGAQPTDTFANILRECERTDGGILYDGPGFALAYIGHAARWNLPVALALDYAAGHLAPPFTPEEDDQRVRNDVTVSNRDGSSARVYDQDSIGAVGRYDDGGQSVNAASSATLAHLAGVRLAVGIVQGLRYSTLALNLARSTDLIDDWLALDFPAKVTIGNLPARYGTDLVDVILEGYTETLDPHTWRVDANLSPARPFDVGILQGGGGVEDPTVRLETAGCVLAADATSGATSLRVVTTAGPKSTTTATRPGDFPFDLAIAGERVTATACADVTAAAFVAAGTAASDGNAAGTATLNPGLPAGLVAGHALLLYAAIRNSGTGTVNTPAGYTLLRRFGNAALFGKIAGSSESAPAVAFTGGAANATVIAQTAAFSNASIAVVAAADQLNTSAQDIAYPGLVVPQDAVLVLYLGWKQDDWTSVATIAGATEIGEPDDAAGSDAGIVWDYLITTSKPNLVPGSFTVTGGAAAISRGAIVVLGAALQTLTVTRAVNGVAKAQTRDTPVSLWRPPGLGY